MTKKPRVSRAGRKPKGAEVMLSGISLRLPAGLKAELERLTNETAENTGNDRWSLPDEIRRRLEKSILIPPHDEAMREESQALGSIMSDLADEVFEATGGAWSTDIFAQYVLSHAFTRLLILRFKAEPLGDHIPSAARDWADRFLDVVPDNAADMAEAIGRQLAINIHGQIHRDNERRKRIERGGWRVKRALGPRTGGDK